MIDVVTSAEVGTPSLVSETPVFRWDVPESNPFMAEASVAFGEGGQAVGTADLEFLSFDSERGRLDQILDDMMDRCQRDIERYPSSPRARVNLGLAFLNHGRPDDAIREFETALEIAPSHYVAAGSLVRVLVLQNRLEDAAKLCRRMLDEHPHDPTPIMNLADIARRSEDFEGAVRLWKEVIALEPESAVARYHLGMVMLSMGDRHGAISQLRSATRCDVRSAPLHFGLGVGYAIAGDLGRAAQSFRAALALSPEMPEAVQGLARVLVREGRWARAVATLEGHLGERPEDYGARELLASIYYDRDDVRAARSELLQALEWVPADGDEAVLSRARMSNNLGAYYFRLGDRGNAGRNFLRSLEAHPDANPAPYGNLARLYLQEDKPDRAHLVLLEGRRRFPEDQDLRWLLAVVLARLEKFDGSIVLLRELIAEADAPAAVFVLLGTLLVDVKRQPEAAVSVLGEAHRRFPEDTYAAHGLAYAFLMLGDTASARALLETCPVEQASGSLKVVLAATHGLLHLLEGDIRAGIRGYRRAEKIARQQGDLGLARRARQKMHLEVARAYMRLGQIAAARQEVREGLLVRGKEGWTYFEHLTELAEALQTVSASSDSMQ